MLLHQVWLYDEVRYRKPRLNVMVLTLVFLCFAYLPRRFREILLLDIFPTERNG
jgi:hypothetical protein